MTHPNGIVEDYRYDAQGRVVEIGVTGDSGRIQVLREASYAPFGPVQRWVFGNHLEFRRTLNKDYRPGVVEDGPEQGTGPGLSLGYEFDVVGNLATLRNGKQHDPPLRIYGYDGLDRLTRIENAAATVLGSYNYDKTGNRIASGQLYTSTSGDDPTGSGGGTTTTTSWLGRTYRYIPNLHRLWTVGATERSYDNAGNTTRIGPLMAIVVDDPPPEGEAGLESASYGGTAPTQSTGQNDGDDGAAGIPARTFDYSAANRMRSVRIDGVLAMSYRYNGKGERVYRSGSGDTVQSLPLGQLAVHEPLRLRGRREHDPDAMRYQRLFVMLETGH